MSPLQQISFTPLHYPVTKNSQIITLLHALISFLLSFIIIVLHYSCPLFTLPPKVFHILDSHLGGFCLMLLLNSLLGPPCPGHSSVQSSAYLPESRAGHTSAQFPPGSTFSSWFLGSLTLWLLFLPHCYFSVSSKVVSLLPLPTFLSTL